MAAAAAGSATGELRLAPHFPFVPRACASVATPFFECFTSKSEQPREGDAVAARRALAECADLMRAYDACVEPALARLAKEGKRARMIARAPDAYRE
mmetsp:Transcript_23113/g.80555  ORF Transcript_23113/g.80555 Transcript_23113/m.80555 type:complete len:97 (+) Transcript_23113:180-470(+)